MLMKLHRCFVVATLLVSMCFSCTEENVSSSEFVFGQLITHRGADGNLTGVTTIRLFRDSREKDGEDIFPGIDFMLVSNKLEKFIPGSYYWSPFTPGLFNIHHIILSENTGIECGGVSDYDPELVIQRAEISIRIDDPNADRGGSLDPKYIIDYNYEVDGQSFSGHFENTLLKVEYLGGQDGGN
jgi:hypothetical protein